MTVHYCNQIFTYQYKNSDEMKGCYKDYIENNGVYPINEKRKWETKRTIK